MRFFRSALLGSVLLLPLAVEGQQLVYQSSTFTDSCQFGGPGNGDLILDPGESAVLQVTAANTGAVAATGVSAVLSSSLTGVSISVNTATFPDIPAGGTGVSDPPGFAFLVNSPPIVCGTWIPFTVQFTANEGTWSDTFLLFVGAPAGSSTQLFLQRFNSGIPATWTIIDGGTNGGPPSTWTWTTSNPGGRTIDPPFSDPWPIVDSDAAGPFATQDEQLITPDLDTTGCFDINLMFSNQFHYLLGDGAEVADVDVSTDGGSSWSNALRMQGPSDDGYPTPNTKTLDLTSFILPLASSKVRFYYHGGEFDWWWAIDNVQLNCTLGACNSCACPTIDLSPASLPDGMTGIAYTQTITAGGGAAPYTFTSSGTLPPGLSLDSSGQLSGTPTVAGTYSFTVTALDANTCSGSRDYTINVACPAIAISPSGLPDGTVGVPYNQSFSASGGAAPYSFSVSSGALPAGLSLDASGSLTGTPSSAGTFSFAIAATDQYGCAGSQPYTIQVACPAVSLSPSSLPNGTEGTPYSQTISASGGTAPYNYTLTSGSLPAGLTLNASSGVLSGTPLSGSAGSYPLIITATDSNNCPGSQPYTLIINPPGCPAITLSPTTLPDGTVGVSYSQTVSGNGGVAPYTFSVTAGSLPDGLSLSTDGLLSGTPAAVGTFLFTLSAEDSNLCSGTQDYAVNVNPGCLFCDDFEDGVLSPDWTYVKPLWSESGGFLVGVPSGKKAVAIASPVFAGCVTCYVESAVETAGGPYNKIWMLGWYVDKKNTMELLLKEENDRIVLKQRVNGAVVKKAKGLFTIDPGVVYLIRITFDGALFTVYAGGNVLFTLTPVGAVPLGTIGFQVKNTTGLFGYIQVN